MKTAIHESHDGISISDARQSDMPLVYVNPAFERLTGYSFEDVIGKNCRLLQGDDTDQPGIEVMRRAIEKGRHCQVILRNYRRDGSMFWNEVSLSPVRDEQQQEITHILGIQRDVTTSVVSRQRVIRRARNLEAQRRRLERQVTEDALTGVFNRGYFDEQLSIYWNIARRSNETLSLFMVDIDWFKQYNDTYGHQAGDECLQEVADELGEVFKRSSDFLARYGGEEFVILSIGMAQDEAREYADGICSRIEAMGIENEASDYGRVTVSVGFSNRVPETGQPEAIVTEADAALYDAKEQGRNRSQAFTPGRHGFREPSPTA